MTEVVGYEEADLIGIEQITYRAYRNGDRFYVRSSTAGSKFYQIIDGACSCKGYMYRNDCQHLKHLHKEGFLDHDIHNGGYRLVPEWRRVSRQTDAEVVTTGETKIVGATDAESRLTDQVGRLQRLSTSQSRLIVAQRRALAASRFADQPWVLARAIKAVEIEESNLAKIEAFLRKGDQVELDV